MADTRDGAPRHAGRRTGSGTGRGIALALTLLFVLAAVSVSAGLVVYTAWRHDLVDGLFALAFAILSARAFLSWFLWRESDQPPVTGYQQSCAGRKSTNDTT